MVSAVWVCCEICMYLDSACPLEKYGRLGGLSSAAAAGVDMFESCLFSCCAIEEVEPVWLE